MLKKLSSQGLHVVIHTHRRPRCLKQHKGGDSKQLCWGTVLMESKFKNLSQTSKAKTQQRSSNIGSSQSDVCSYLEPRHHATWKVQCRGVCVCKCAWRSIETCMILPLTTQTNQKTKSTYLRQTYIWKHLYLPLQVCTSTILGTMPFWHGKKNKARGTALKRNLSAFWRQ